MEAVWHGEVEDEDVRYSREALLSAQAISMDEVQWAANVVRSRCTHRLPSLQSKADWRVHLKLFTVLTVLLELKQELDGW